MSAPEPEAANSPAPASNARRRSVGDCIIPPLAPTSPGMHRPLSLLDSFSHRLAPSEALDEASIRDGVRWWTRNGLGAQAMDTLAAGAFITAFALQLGASPIVVGILAALPHLSQIGQIAGVYMADRLRNRRLICVLFTGVSRPLYLAMAAAALLPDP